MGYAVVHMMKIKAGGVRGIQSHNNREKPSKTNPDIKPAETPKNYDIIPSQHYQKNIKETIETFATETKTVRKDAVVLCNFIVTSDEQTMKAMSTNQQQAFFEDSVKWFSDRYGGENIINATVHMDETTPHMHIGIVPITDDGRLSAKKLFDRKEMTAIQTDFVKDVGEHYGLERGKEGSTRTHLSEQQYKIKTSEEKLNNIKQKAELIVSQANEKAQEGQEVFERVKLLEEKEKALKGQIRALESELKARELNIREINSIQPKKALGGTLKGISVEDIENLKSTALKGLNATQSLKKLQCEYDRLKKIAPTMEEMLDTAKVKTRLAETEKRISQLPVDIQQEYFSQKVKQKNKTIRHSR